MTRKIAFTTMVAISITASAWADSRPTVTVSGHVDTYHGFVKLNSNEPIITILDSFDSVRRDHALVNETKLLVRADGKLENMYGIRYGGLIYLNADTSDDHYEDEFDAQQTMAYFEGKFGRLEAGSFTGASHALHVSATQVARGHSGIDGGGIDSDWWKWVNPKSRLRSIALQYMLLPQIYTNNIALVGIKGVNASKITYFTPTWRGFQAGITYIPDTESSGTVSKAMQIFKIATDTPALTFSDVLEGGIRYTGKIKNVGIKVGLIGQTGKGKTFEGDVSYPYHRLNAWEAGMAARYKDWIAAGAIGSQGKGGQEDDNNWAQSRYWNVGLAYENGPFGASLTYAVTRAQVDFLIGEGEQRRRVHTFGAGLDWQIAKGAKLYTDFTQFHLRSIDEEGFKVWDRGRMIRVGSLLNF